MANVKLLLENERLRMLSMALIVIIVFETAFILSSGFSTSSTYATTQHTILTNSSNVALARLSGEMENASAKMEFGWGNVINEMVSANALNGSLMSKYAVNTRQIGAINGTSNDDIFIDSANSTFDLYALWALGMNNENPIINNGTIMDFGGDPYSLASTGGYAPLGKLQLGNLSLIKLTASEQALVLDIADNTYRPCCNNPASFPDCNHGAAQLGLIEIMAAHGSNSSSIYNALEKFNEINYPEQYAEIAAYLNSTQGISMDAVPAETILGRNFSSYAGSAAIHQYLASKGLLPPSGSGGSSC